VHFLLFKENQSKEDIMAQYVENVLKYDRVSRRKSGLGRLRMFFDAAPGVQSRKKVDEGDCDGKTKTWEDDMKEKLGGWWW
jgi:hypothetical protein